MSDGPFLHHATSDRRLGGPLDTLAKRALNVVRANHGDTPLQAEVRHIAHLYAAVCAPTHDGPATLLRQFQAAQVRPETIADVYIPAVARLLGDAWCADEMSFADVTIGTARLQSLLRELGPLWPVALERDEDRPEVAVVIPEDEDHTLGAMVLTGQLRRMGVSVRLFLGEPSGTLYRAVREHAPDAILVSAAQDERLSRLRGIVDRLRAACDVPVIVGGAVLETERDVAAETGADLATTDPRAALVACGLLDPTRGTLSRRRATPARMQRGSLRR